MSWALDLGVAIPALAIGLVAQWWVRHAIAEADEVPTSAGVSGRVVAHRLLLTAGVGGVSVDSSQAGELSDHYDGRNKVIRLADADSATVAAVAVAAHEVGHASQDADGSAMFRLRSAIAPVAAVASVGWVVLVFFGFLLGIAGLVHLAVLVFATVAAFHLVTLPVEIQASRKALKLVRAAGVVSAEEQTIVRKVLAAAALTYLAAALVSVAQIIEFLFMGEE